MDAEQLKMVIEAILLAAGRPLTLDQLLAMFEEQEKPERQQVREAVTALQADYAGRGIDLVEVGSGYRVQVRASMQPWVSRLWEEKPTRYSRALLETLALIAYRQPITRGEIEDVRGVSVSSNIIKTLQEREWIHVVGHREVPGRPAMYGTTRHFLDYFNLKTLDELPSLAELRDLNEIGRELDLDLSDIPGLQTENDAAEEPAEAAADEESLPLVEPAAGESGATIH
jgi:segregation and condensation protein B